VAQCSVAHAAAFPLAGLRGLSVNVLQQLIPAGTYACTHNSLDYVLHVLQARFETRK
jgi:hypothetical protein